MGMNDVDEADKELNRKKEGKRFLLLDRAASVVMTVLKERTNMMMMMMMIQVLVGFK